MTGGAGGKEPDVQKWQWTPHGMAAADDNSISWVEGRDYDALAAELEAVRKRADALLCKSCLNTGYIDSDGTCGNCRLGTEITKRKWAESALTALKDERAEVAALPYVVQYRGKGTNSAPLDWTDMAAFDHEGPATAYATQCSDTEHWEYRVYNKVAPTADEVKP